MMTVQARHVTVAEFMALPDDGNRHELVRGELRVMPPPKGTHGVIEATIVEAIGRYLYDRAMSLGWQPAQGVTARTRLVGLVAVGEFGLQFSIPDDPHQIRGADGVYIPAEQLDRVMWDGSEYFPGVPHLVIEVISSSDRAGVVAEKVQDYLAGGAHRVWCVYPEQRTVHVYDPGRPLRMIRGDETLTDEEILPGFSLPLTMIFYQW